LLPNGKVLVAGGSGLTSAELYDPASGTWTVTGRLANGRESATATLLPDGRVLVAGGVHTGGVYTKLTSAEVYDPISGRWTATGNMVAIRGFGIPATLLPDGKVLVAGGSGSASAELYDPASGTWTATRSMEAARADQTATLLLDGQVLVAGGESVIGGTAGPVASAEIYAPGSGN
jgi:N-acetylneuraminic acid mutarotase